MEEVIGYLTKAKVFRRLNSGKEHEYAAEDIVKLREIIGGDGSDLPGNYKEPEEKAEEPKSTVPLASVEKLTPIPAWFNVG